MQYKKNNPDKVINLQSGMYCHITDEFLVINENLNLDEKDFAVTLDKTRNIRKLRLSLNFIFTIAVFSFAIYSGFYPISLLLFVSLWDIRQLGRYVLPINQSNCIPLQNIESIKITKGGMGMNYMDITINNKGVKSLKPLKLYDSASTFEQSKAFAISLGKLSSFHESTKEKIIGEVFPLNEVETYVLANDKLHFCYNGIYNYERKDNYIHIRTLSIIILGIGLAAIAAKIHIMTNSYYNYVDFTVLLFFVLLLQIPFKYLQKALPNSIDIKDIQKFSENKKYVFLHLKTKYGVSFKVYLPKKHIQSQIERLKTLVSK